MAPPPLTIPRAQRLPWLIAMAALVAAGWLGWKAYRPSPWGDPVATSLVAFEKQDRLTVFSAQLAPVVSADDVRGYGLLKSRQIAVIPARVDYAIDLARLDAARFRWDPASRGLVVTLPPVQPGKPNLDEARAQYLREGVWITGEAQAKLTRDNTLLAEQQAVQQAINPILLGLARAAAKQAVASNLAVPLRVAGYGDVKVTVRFADEKEPQ